MTNKQRFSIVTCHVINNTRDQENISKKKKEGIH